MDLRIGFGYDMHRLQKGRELWLGGIKMNRVEKFKELRMRRRRSFLCIVLFVFIILAGFATVDYSLNSIMNNEKRIRMISFKRVNDSCISIGIMNMNMKIDLGIVNKSCDKIKKMLKQ